MPVHKKPTAKDLEDIAAEQVAGTQDDEQTPSAPGATIAKGATSATSAPSATIATSAIYKKHGIEIRPEYMERIHQLAYWKRLKIREVIDEALGEYLEGKDIPEK